MRLLLLFIPPIILKLSMRIIRFIANTLSTLPKEFSDLPRSQHGLYKLITDFDLEHQPDPGTFIRRCIDLTTDNGVICITVPPLKNKIVGGHLTLWNAGLLLYQLVFNGLDCRHASICTYGYNVTIIVKKKIRKNLELDYDNGDIRRLKEFFPSFVDEPFDGIIKKWNW